ncbi:MAG TPA: J domain-containing protein [Hyphomicrobiaceae bacterium]
MQWTSRLEWVLSFAPGPAGRLAWRAESQQRTLYEVLGVAPAAAEPDIKAAYRALARQLHPDLNAGDAVSAARLAEVNGAYATLANAEARAAYDRELARRQSEARRRLATFAATGAATFVLTTGVVSFAVRRHLDAAPAPQPPPAAQPAPAQSATPAAALAGYSEALAGLSDPARAAIWRTYRDPRFDFSLRYPAGIFTLDAARSDANVHTFVSRDGRAVLRIVAAENTARIALADLRRALMKGRYAGAAFDSAPRRRHWFALSGTRGDEVFLERITYSCDGKSMHGWQMLYPATQRGTYDELARLVLRNHPHGNGPPSACEDPRPRSGRQAGANRRVR